MIKFTRTFFKRPNSTIIILNLFMSIIYIYMALVKRILSFNFIANLKNASRSRLLSTSRIFSSDSMDFVIKNNTLDDGTKERIKQNVKEETKNWMSYGISMTDKDEDKFNYVAIYFMLITLAGGVSVFYLTFIPRQREKDWAVREAYFELERREKLGLPLIDKNYVSPDRVTLPTDEQLGNIRIIV